MLLNRLSSRVGETRRIHPPSMPVRTVREEQEEGALGAIIESVHRAPERSRIEEFAEHGLIHLSTLIRTCPRYLQLAAENSNPTVQYSAASSSMRIVWALGRAAEKEVREAFFTGYGKGNVMAIWSCVCGDTAYGPALHNPEWARCETCNHPIDRFHEAPIRDLSHGIVGNADLVYVLPSGEFEVVEIKSIKADDFRKLRGPDRMHVLQAAGYQRLWRQEYRVAPKVRILYVSKDAVVGQTTKEYLVDTGGWVADRLDQLWEIARGVRDGVMAPRICAGVEVPSARICPVNVQCFSYGD